MTTTTYVWWFAALTLAAAPPAFAQKEFTFFAIGDMPYNNPRDLQRFEHLIREINAEKPAFTVHVGDIKNGSSDCSDGYYQTILSTFNRFINPLIYTPGDNEWTDCNRPACGGYDPEERLATVRRIFFANAESLGQKPIPLVSERNTAGFEKFVENARWRKQGVTFATLHVVGSNNNLKTAAPNHEYLERDQANMFWLHETFTNARSNGNAAVVLFMQASMVYEPIDGNGFIQIVDKLREEVVAFGKPVLLVYGDLHRLMISKPLKDARNRVIPNFTALMVFGEQDVDAVKVTVDARSRAVFSFSEFQIDDND